jgi:serine/threonine protein kinase
MEHNFDQEYIFKSNQNVSFQINPAQYGITLSQAAKSCIDLTHYLNVSEIYREALAPTSISLAVMPTTNEKVCIKRTFKEYLVNDFQKEQAAQEFPLHCSFRHENIVRGLEWSENSTEYLMVMEYMNKAEYFNEKIDVNLCPVKSELKMKSYISDTLEGLSYLHSKGIVHGDIKLQNMLVSKTEDDDGAIPIVKLCDFGLSRILSKDTGKFYMEFQVGSIPYMAPEIQPKSNVDEKIDMWALGVTLYKMAVAYKPTQIAGYKYGNGPVPFRKVDWRKRSHELQDLITNLLEVDSNKRISVEEALQHPWFQI